MFSVPAFFQRNAFMVRLDIIRGMSNTSLVIDNIRLARKKCLYSLHFLHYLVFLG